LSFSIETEAFTFCAVPPARVWSETAALEVWFLTLRTSPAPIVMIDCPVFC